MAENNSKTRLDSWKEIAEYLGRDVRTVIRWEKDKGLPVHRVPGGKHHSVFAYPAEIDAWLASGSAVINGAAAVPPRRVPWDWALGVAAVLLVVAGVVGVRSFWRAEPAQVERITFESERLVAWDARGKQLWAYQFGGPLAGVPPGNKPEWLVRIVDLDADGAKEVLVGLNYRDPTPDATLRAAELVCFSSRGEIRWRYTPRHTFQFGEQRFEPPWALFDLLVAEVDGRTRLWVIGAHYLWGTSFVEEIDPASGAAELRFLNPGVLYRLGLVRGAAGNFLLAGGFNNEYDAGALAVLELGQSFAFPPQQAPRYTCRDCPPGRPWRYFAFPRSELNRVARVDLNAVGHMQISETRAEVSTFELDESARAIYEFPPDFDTARLEFNYSSTYWRRHQQLEEEGKLDHPAGRCPDRTRPAALRVWSSEAEWTDVRLPAAGLPAVAQQGRKAPVKSSE